MLSTAIPPRCETSRNSKSELKGLNLNGVTVVLNYGATTTADEARNFCAAENGTLPVLNDEKRVTAAKWVTGE